jgi:hypothetical protein
MSRLLEPHRPGDGPGKTARFSVPEQRQEVESTNLSLKAGACRTGGGRGNNVRKFGVTPAHGYVVPYFFVSLWPSVKGAAGIAEERLGRPKT